MTLHVERRGNGPDLVLLHGWGFQSGVWRSLVEPLAARFRLTLVDLPGHGRSYSPPSDGRLEAVADRVAAAVPADVVWLGWSLGGLVALQAAISHPERVKKLVLVACTPRFMAAPDWPEGIAPAALAELAAGLKENPAATLKRFVLLQLHGSERAKQAARLLFPHLTSPIYPGGGGLGVGLALLRESDLRARLPAVRCPALLLMGELDPLVPVRIGDWMLRHLPQAQLSIIPGAGHAPFLSHPELFQQALENFLEE